jgi:hypothetical protein
MNQVQSMVERKDFISNNIMIDRREIIVDSTKLN